MMDPAAKSVECYLCRKPLTGIPAEESYCFGCHQNVCEGCSTNFDLPFGGHDVSDHQGSDEDGESE